MSNFKKEYHNPLDLIKNFWPNADTSHIEFDPKMKANERDYWRIDQSGGDGTLLFTVEMLQKCLLPIVNKTSYCKATEPDWSKVKGVKYIVGKMRHVTVYGLIELKCGGKYSGLRERVRFPVKCEYLYF